MSDMHEYTFQILDEPSQLNFGAHLAKFCPPGVILFLCGDLGAGKTTFARGFLRGLGYEGKVKSPTYALVEEYVIKTQHIVHVDLYRLENEIQVDELSLHDILHPESICLIEWPERAQEKLPKADLTCYIAPRFNGREIRIVAHTAKGQQLLSAVHREWQA